MTRHRKLEHRFVEQMPEQLESGVLYVSLEFCTTSHLCCCGCGEEVVTPLSPVGWRITFDGETVSLWPSIGSWTLSCRSHYVIDKGTVRTAAPWTEEQFEVERDRTAREQHYGPLVAVPIVLPLSQPPVPPARARSGWTTRLRRWIFGGR